MKKIILLVCFALNLVFATSGAEGTEVKASVQNSEFRTITDQLGREVKIPQNVEKIVVLQHQSLNLLVQLGAKDKITGVLESWEKNDSEPGADGARIPAAYVISMLERLVEIDFPVDF